ncbi:MAG: hypothetical protein CL573_05015 [Alphaproteobacteria bacterium]|nr:hypothetical protein [Alphaproteobacteria bacterium]
MPSLTKGQSRKLNALKKSIGDELGQEAFDKWLKRSATEKIDPVADTIVDALSKFEKDKSFNLGAKGYTVFKSRGRGAKGIRAIKNS